MPHVTWSIRAWKPRVLSILRFVAGLAYMDHGTAKLFGFPSVGPYDPSGLLGLNGIEGVLATFGGLLILLGLFTRPTAFILSGEMAIGYFVAHAPRSFFPVVSGGDPALLYCFIFLYLSVAGGGAWSLDRLRRRPIGVPVPDLG